MKKIISIFLSLIMMFSLCVTASAEGENGDSNGSTESTTSKVTSISLNVKPILGSKVNGTDYVANMYFVKVDSVTPSESKDELVYWQADWYKVADKDYTGDYEKDKEKLEYIYDESEVFQDGYHYYVDAMFVDMVDEETWLQFKEGITGTINGEKASTGFSGAYGDCALSVAGYVDVLGFNNIDMTVTKPALGATADYEPTHKISDEVNDKVYGPWATIKTTWSKVETDSYTGVDDSAWVEMSTDEKITTGYYYMVKFDVLEDNNPKYDWLYRTISKNLTGSLNGEDFDKIVVANDQYSAELYKVFEPLVKTEPTPTVTSGWDDGGPFTTDTCGNVYDRWGNKIYEATSCNVSGYNLVRTDVKD